MDTVQRLIERMMPGGTHLLPGAPPDWHRISRSPIDVFAVAAALVERSGAYRFVIAPGEGPKGNKPKDHFGLKELQGENWGKVAKAWALGIYPSMKRAGAGWDAFVKKASEEFPDKTEEEKAEYRKLFERDYYSFSDVRVVDMGELEALWNALYNEFGSREVVSAEGDKLEDWWAPALKLLILADMASMGVGFRKLRRGGKESVESVIQKEVLDKAARANRAKPKKPHLTTITDVVDSTFCSVLPKTRTASLGCTLRSLSHNLAFLPSPGMVEARWRIPGQNPPSPIDTGDPKFPSKSLNLLLIPFPWRIGSECFVGRTDVNDDGEDWSYFDISQRWLQKDESELKEMARFFGDLVEDAANDLKEIHGVIFPECSLNAAAFEAICDEFTRRRDRTKFEFVVAGVSEEPEPHQEKKPRRAPTRARPHKRGNFVCVRGVAPDGKDGWHINSAREKHHRWKLNQAQIERYGLSARLDPKKNWWEAIPLSRRVVEFFEPRAGTSMTVLICEDLARADPCQTVVRSVGPNLVLALLMDGPQRKFRWPGHYAGVLADDPGSSVLTLTSYGLIARGAAGDESQSRSIAFFRNSLGQERELFLPSGFHALAVRMNCEDKTEHTLDGRGDGRAAFIWSLKEVSPIRGRTDERNKWIVEDMR